MIKILFLCKFFLAHFLVREVARFLVRDYTKRLHKTDMDCLKLILKNVSNVVNVPNIVRWVQL